jgi:hypothetical protein
MRLWRSSSDAPLSLKPKRPLKVFARSTPQPVLTRNYPGGGGAGLSVAPPAPQFHEGRVGRAGRWGTNGQGPAQNPKAAANMRRRVLMLMTCVTTGASRPRLTPAHTMRIDCGPSLRAWTTRQDRFALCPRRSTANRTADPGGLPDHAGRATR